MLQEQLHTAHMRAEAAEQGVARAEQLQLQLADLQVRQKMWDQVLQARTKSNVTRHQAHHQKQTHQDTMLDPMQPCHSICKR